MLLFKTILLILLACITMCAVVFVYRKILRLPDFWRNTGMIIFFVLSCHNFGLKWTTISILYLSVCFAIFILRALLASSKTKYDNKTIYSALLRGTGFSYNKFKGYSKQPLNTRSEEEQETELIKLNSLVLCALVPLWLIYFLSKKTFNNSFRIVYSFYSNTFIIRNKITPFLKSIKIA
jgi:hypothetical protein